MFAHSKKLVIGAVSAIALSIGAAGAQSVGDAVGDVTGAVGDVTGSVTGAVGDVTGGVSGAVGDVTGSVTGNSGDLDSDIGDVGQVSDTAQFSDVLSLVNQGDAAIGDVGQISEVQVVDVQNIANFDADTLNDAVSQNSVQVAELQETLNSNEALSNAFNNAGVDVSDIVAIDASDSGNVTVYTSDSR
jgi:hypothetical protein